MIKVYDRKTKKIIIEKQYKEQLLTFLYNNAIGRIFLKLVINPVFSKINGIYNNLSISKRKIVKWIMQYNINMDLYEQVEYKNFNQFFTRKLKSINEQIDSNSFIAPCQAKLLVYKIDDDLRLKIKNSIYTLNELFKENDLSIFKNGYCFLYHLTVDCYHRYCYIDNGKTLLNKEIKGKLHTISSISKDYKIYKENHRTYSILDTENFGQVLFMEVGALLVGKIKNANKMQFNKGDEKGYFELGGSTIIVLVGSNKVKVDNDILINSKKNIETKVDYKEKVGSKYD